MAKELYLFVGLVLTWSVILFCFHVPALTIAVLLALIFAGSAYLGWEHGNVFEPRFRPGTTLVVIDMQEGFLRQLLNPQKTIDAVLLEIARAIRLEQTILVVRFRGSTAIDDRIFKSLDGYSKWHRVGKSLNDGGPTVSDACMIWRCGTERFRLVGINSDACVYETAVSLAYNYPQSRIEVAVNACDTANDTGWAAYMAPEAANVLLVDYAGISVDPATLPPPRKFLALPIGNSWPGAAVTASSSARPSNFTDK